MTEPSTAYFQMLNRGKRSVALDLRAGGAQALIRLLIDAAATLTSSLGLYALGGSEPLRRIGAESYWYVPAGNFEAADGEWVQLVAISEQHWRAVCRVLGHPEWIDRFAPNEQRVSDRALVHGLIADAIKLRPAEALAEEIRAAGGLCQRIREIEEAWADPLVAGG